MNKLIGYLVFGVIAFVALYMAVSFLTKERIYYTAVEGIVSIHSNKWGNQTMDFHFQYPHYVEPFSGNPGAAALSETVTFADGSRFVVRQVSTQSLEFTAPTPCPPVRNGITILQGH